MYSYSPKSLAIIDTCHQDIQDVMFDLIQIMDVKPLEGFRNKERQNEMVELERSKLEWPNSKHNSQPSMAIDVVPYPVKWPDPLKYPDTWHKYYARFYYMAGIILALGRARGLVFRWGGDWNRNNTFTDQSFDDLPHFELVG